VPGAHEPLVRVEGLVKHFPLRRGLWSRQAGVVKAVDDVSFDIRRGETLCLVGESGCGKSTTARLILRLLEPTAGKVFFEGKNIFELPAREMRSLRKEMQLIFQDPYASLNARMTVGEIIGEPLVVHKLAKGAALERRVKELLEAVGLASYHAKRYPHEFSGGQRQRIGIARALAVNPKLVVCDEPVSALDVSVQAQVLNLLKDLQDELQLTYLFIAHDLSVVKHMGDRIAVMYLGKIVEVADKASLYQNPQHPYTRALMSAIPIADPTVKRERILLEGDVPSAINPPRGCRFHTRCPIAQEICAIEEPPLRMVGEGHACACHLVPAAASASHPAGAGTKAGVEAAEG